MSHYLAVDVDVDVETVDVDVDAADGVEGRAAVSVRRHRCEALACC